MPLCMRIDGVVTDWLGAVYIASVDIVRVLLTSGANVEVQNCNGRTPVHLVRRIRYTT
jgi:hypothetical protein